MRLRVFVGLLVVVTLLAPILCHAVEPSVALIDTIAVGNGKSIMINVEEALDPAIEYTIKVKPEGGSASPVTVKVRGLRLTTGDPRLKPKDRKTLPLDMLKIAADFPVPIFFRNLTRQKLRITLQQPIAPKGTPKEKLSLFCTPTCTLDPGKYDELCKRDSKSPSRCKPVIGMCGSADCVAVRTSCDKPDCSVDLYKALETCSCSVPKTVEASTYPLEVKKDDNATDIAATEALKASRYVITADGNYALRVPSIYSGLESNATALSIAAENVGATIIKTEVSNENVGDYPTVLFDAGLFIAKESKDGKSRADDAYRFLIEQDPAAPAENDVVTESPKADYVGAVLIPIAVSASPTLVANQQTGQPVRAVVVPLDDTGVANWRYLNPRNPACINCLPGGQPLPPNLAPAGVVFRNRSQDRTFLISITLPATAPANSIDDSFKCTPGQPCKITRSVAPLNTVLFDSTILSVFKKALIKFEIAPYGETVTLGNAAAYLSLENPFDDKGKSTLTERASATNFKTKLSLSGRVDPQVPAVPTKDEVGKKDDAGNFIFDLTKLCIHPGTADKYVADNEPPICKVRPYVDGSTQAYKGNGSINLTANLADRADGSVTLSFRDGNYGSDIDKTAVSEYNVTIYGINGLSLKFGKADYLIPSNGIAISESGEGFLYSWRSFGLGHVIRRESDAGIPLDSNNDKKDWFFQARSLSIAQRLRNEIATRDALRASDQGDQKSDVGVMRRTVSYLRSADLFVVRGEDKKINSTYTTAGGEIFFARPANPLTAKQTKDGTILFNIFSGSFAGYQSRKHLDDESNCKADLGPLDPKGLCSGRGNAWLLTVNWTPSMVIAGGTNAATTPHTLSFAIGQGSGNKPGTMRDEGYIGEPANFASDRLFLKTFVAKMNSKNVQYEPLGLSNKRYTAITYTNSETSLFDFVASALGVKDDVNSRSTIVSLREYRLRYSENGARGAAREANVTFNIEVPKGVTFSFDANYLDPGEAFKDRITKRAWSFGANVTLSL